mmetsp:Transcript_23411/g.41403  ORF Transcript_23411/g.41403 Transcript_23411/m.41403 type:complete len:82 (+) Transcript_23411:50-295(+)
MDGMSNVFIPLLLLALSTVHAERTAGSGEGDVLEPGKRIAVDLSSEAESSGMEASFRQRASGSSFVSVSGSSVLESAKRVV